MFNVFPQDELVAVSEKAVLRVPDLLDWLADPAEVTWDRGSLGVYGPDCAAPEDSTAQHDTGLNEKFSPWYSEFMQDVRREKQAIGEFDFL